MIDRQEKETDYFSIDRYKKNIMINTLIALKYLYLLLGYYNNREVQVDINNHPVFSES